jgi:hypothetical protein
MVWERVSSGKRSKGRKNCFVSLLEGIREVASVIFNSVKIEVSRDDGAGRVTSKFAT